MNPRTEPRLVWIETSLRLRGAVDLATYRKVFDISPSQASADVRTFVARACDAGATLKVDRNRFEGGLPDEIVVGVMDPVDWLGTFDTSRFERLEITLSDSADRETVSALVQGLLDEEVIEIEYLSQTSGFSRKQVSPNRIVVAAGRRHMRGYDHDKGRYADFALGRILRVIRRVPEKNFLDARWDKDWNEIEAVEIEADEDLSPEKRRAVEMAYGIPESGRRFLHGRRALRTYILQALGLKPEGYVRHLVARIEGRKVSS